MKTENLTPSTEPSFTTLVFLCKYDEVLSTVTIGRIGPKYFL